MNNREQRRQESLERRRKRERQQRAEETADERERRLARHREAQRARPAAGKTADNELIEQTHLVGAYTQYT